jgi:hypothetical protein
MFRLARFSGSKCGQAAVHNNAEHWTKQNPDTCTNKPLAAMGRHRPPWACFLPVSPIACWTSRRRSARRDWTGLAAAWVRWGKSPKRRWNTRLPTGVSSLVGVCSGRVCLMQVPAAEAGTVECGCKRRFGIRRKRTLGAEPMLWWGPALAPSGTWVGASLARWRPSQSQTGRNTHLEA